MHFSFTKLYSFFLIAITALALSACGGGGGGSDSDGTDGTDSTTTDTQQEVGRHVYFRYNYNPVYSYNYETFPNSSDYVLVAANCSEQRFVEDNDGEIYNEDTFDGTATVTIANGEANVSITGTTELQSAGFGHCPQGIPGNGTSFSSDIRCYDDNEILYLKAVQDHYADGEVACTTAVGGSLEP